MLSNRSTRFCIKQFSKVGISIYKLQSARNSPLWTRPTQDWQSFWNDLCIINWGLSVNIQKKCFNSLKRKQTKANRQWRGSWSATWTWICVEFLLDLANVTSHWQHNQFMTVCNWKTTPTRSSTSFFSATLHFGALRHLQIQKTFKKFAFKAVLKSYGVESVQLEQDTCEAHIE